MTPPSSDEVVSVVKKAIDADEYDLHAVMPTGESQHLRFYLVIWEVPHRDAGDDDVPADATLLKERYFQMPKEGAPSDLTPTFKKNGIARRNLGGLKKRLVKAYARVSNVEGDDAPSEPLWLEEAE